MTVARFRQSLRDGETFAKALDGMRRFDFGESTVDSLELVKTDWYMSRRSMEVLGKFTLSPAARDDRQY